jgi:hypothetical protein
MADAFGTTRRATIILLSHPIGFPAEVSVGTNSLQHHYHRLAKGRPTGAAMEMRFDQTCIS